MGRPFASALVPALLAGTLLAAPARADTPPIACPADDGRERITTDGFKLDFDAPAVLAPELAATRQVTGDGVMRQRSAHFFFRADFTPYVYGTLDFSLNWTNTSDFDLYVFDAVGSTLAASAARVIDGGDTKLERAEVTELPHCADFSVEIRNWAGRPDELLKLDIAFKDPGPLMACAKDDPAPGCAGLEAGEPPVRIPDTRTRLYAGGDRPGQLAMQGHYLFGTVNQGDPPVMGRLGVQRPTGGKTNTFTHTLTGNTQQHQNPFMANFTIPVSNQRITGDVTALVWVSSQTLKNGGTLFVDLWRDGTSVLQGTRIARATIPGTAVGTIATPIFVRFANLNETVQSELVLQVSSPLASDNPGNAEWTLYYDSVQFPSRITLNPFTDPPPPA